MMVKSGYKCDRCGAYVAEDNAVEVQIVFDDGGAVADLCPNCSEDLVSFLFHKKEEPDNAP